jgi:hypothetical protein
LAQASPPRSRPADVDVPTARMRPIRQPRGCRASSAAADGLSDGLLGVLRFVPFSEREYTARVPSCDRSRPVMETLGAGWRFSSRFRVPATTDVEDGYTEGRRKRRLPVDGPTHSVLPRHQADKLQPRISTAALLFQCAAFSLPPSPESRPAESSWKINLSLSQPSPSMEWKPCARGQV